MRKKRTEQELLVQESMDEDVYKSTRSMFEYILGRLIEKAQMGEDPSSDREALLSCFNSTSQSAQNLNKMVRRLENEKL